MNNREKIEDKTKSVYIGTLELTACVMWFLLPNYVILSQHLTKLFKTSSENAQRHVCIPVMDTEHLV